MPGKSDISQNISITFEGNFFNTPEQIAIKKKNTFLDTFEAKSLLPTGSSAAGFFSRTPAPRPSIPSNPKRYPTITNVIDSSGNSRAILDPSIDIFASSSVDIYRNGVEIREEKHWTAGFYKISAGTPGHLFDNTFFGATELSLTDHDKYFEIDTFDPVKFIRSGGDPTKITYPIVTNDSNESANYITNGIIEPFPIRSVITNLSINFPFEPRSFKGEFSAGNSNFRSASDQILSLDYFHPGKQEKTHFLDAVEMINFSVEGVSVALKSSIGYLSLDENNLDPFEDADRVRNSYRVYYIGTNIDPLQKALEAMRSEKSDTYVTDRQKAATSGYTYDDSTLGTDSIAFGNIRSSKRLFTRKTLNARDAAAFSSTTFTEFDDLESKPHVPQLVQYPSLIPVTHITGSAAYIAGEIEVVRPISPSLYEYVERDCKITANP
jgi:hypothetical protein